MVGVGRATDTKATGFLDTGDADFVGLVTTENVVAGGVFSDVEADVTTAIATEDEDVTEGWFGYFDSVVQPVPRPERVFHDLMWVVFTEEDYDSSEESTPWDIVVGVSFDCDTGLVQKITPSDDGFVGTFANDFLGAEVFECIDDIVRKDFNIVEPLVLGWEFHKLLILSASLSSEFAS